MTLGFDASTAICGWAFYDGSKIVDAGFINLTKHEANKAKVFHVIDIIKNNPNLKSTTKINLEAALFGFMGGRTSQQTIIKLARFNAIFEYIISEQWNIPVNLISVTTARKLVFGKARIKGMTGKEYVRQQIDLKFPYLHKFDKLNKKNEPDAHNEDLYDAAVISMVK
jgi:hypothetical protein